MVKQTRRYSRRKPSWQLDIANERIKILFGLADKEFPKRPDLSKRYVELARRVGTKFNISMRPEHKARFCKKCGEFLVYGKNARHRLVSEEHKVEITCLSCEAKRTIPYVREIKAKRKAKTTKR